MQQQAQQYGQQSLISGLQSIGQVGQSLYDQKLKMAQALAQSKVFSAAHPELTTPQQTTMQAPVMRNQTAAFDPSTGSVTPNTQLSGVATSVPQTTTSAPLIDQGSLQTALLGLAPKDLLDSLTQGQAAKTAQGELALRQRTEPERLDIEKQNLAAQQQLNRVLAGFKGQEQATTATRTANEDTNTLLSRRDELIKDLTPFNIGPKSQAATTQIAAIDALLASKGKSPQKNPSSMQWNVTPNATKYRLKS